MFSSTSDSDLSKLSTLARPTVTKVITARPNATEEGAHVETKEEAKNGEEKLDIHESENLISHQLTKAKQLNSLLLICKDLFKPDSPTENHFLFNHLVSLLTGIPINKLLTKEYEVYHRHINNLPTLKGWRVNRFLPLRILALFKTLFYVSNGMYSHLAPDSSLALLLEKDKDAHARYLALLHEEIIRLLSALFVDRAISAIRLLPHEFERAAAKKLSTAIAHLIISSKHGKEFVFPGGWNGHAIYIGFIPYGDDIIVRIDNLGFATSHHFPKDHPFFPGRPLHESLPDDTTMLLPRFIGKIPKAKIDRLTSYLDQLIFSRCCTHWNDRAISESIGHIYHFSAGIFDPIDTSFNMESHLLKSQTTENCTAESMKAGLFARFGDLLARSVLEDEKYFLSARPPRSHSSLIKFKQSLEKRYGAAYLSDAQFTNTIIDTLFLLLSRSHFFAKKYATLLDECQLYILYHLLKNGYDPEVAARDTELGLALNYLKDTTHLNLSKLQLTDGQAIVLAGLIPYLTKLVAINLKHNQISDRGGAALRDAFNRNRTFKRLHLHNNLLTDKNAHLYKSPFFTTKKGHALEKDIDTPTVAKRARTAPA